MCEYECTRPETLKSHKDRVHEGKLFYCDECAHAASSKTCLRLHKECKHGSDDIGKEPGGQPRVQCHLCAFMTTKNKLKHHIDIEHVGLRFYCDKCEFKSKTKPGLDMHILSKHEGVRFNCDECSSSFSSESNLKTHKKRHKSISIPCSHCSKVFLTVTHMTRHTKQRHSKLGRFSCDLCNFSAAASSSLRRHKEGQHEGIRYPCDECNYSATQLGQLRDHRRRKHAIKTK